MTVVLSYLHEQNIYINQYWIINLHVKIGQVTGKVFAKAAHLANQ